MTITTLGTNRARLLRTCYVTVLLNSLFASACAEDAAVTAPLNKPPADSSLNILHYGPFDVFPQIRAGMTYDDNIYIRPTGKQSDVIWTLSPGVVLGAGDYSQKEENFAIIEYDPAFILFTRRGRNNAIDHDAKLDLQWHPANWTIGLQQGFQAYSGSVVDVGNRVDRKIYTTGLQVKYEISPKTSAELVGSQSINNYNSFNSFQEWTAGGWLDYWITPKIRLGAGVTAGFVDIQNSVNQTYQQGLLRASYSMTEKVGVRASAGVEVREFQGGYNSKLNGVFSLGATYRPLESTQVLLDTYRRNQASVVLQDQSYTTTGLSATLQQTFLEKYTASLSGGYDHLKYFATSATAAANRADNYYFVRVGVDWNATEKFTVGTFYQYRKNTSSTPNFRFSNNQMGLNASYQF